MNEKDLVIVEVAEKKGVAPLIIPPEMIILLWGKLDLVGLFNALLFLANLRLTAFIPQPKLAKLVGLSYPTFLVKRKELEKLGLIDVQIENSNTTRMFIRTDKLWGLINSLRGSIKNFKTPPVFSDAKKLEDYLDSLRKSLLGVLSQKDQLPLSFSIYNNIVSLKSKDISNEEKVERVKFPKEDYTLVLNVYKKYKGVGLFGPEIKQHLRAIKTMFLANRKPNEIVKFMEWLHKNENNSETPWVRLWTIWTVQKKIPEFLAGKLKGEVEESEPL